MATRSMIGIMEDDVCKAVYCHWDGYVEHNGVILNKYYTDVKKVNSLIALGDLSVLGAELGDKHDFNSRNEYLVDAGIETSVATQCTFYGRDREEKNVDFKTYSNFSEMVSNAKASGCEFVYIMRDGEWFVSSGNMTHILELKNKLNIIEAAAEAVEG